MLNALDVHSRQKAEDFKALEAKLGVIFTLDAFSKDSGSNRLCHHYCSPSRPFQKHDAAGEIIWMHPPYLRITQALRHFRRLKERMPCTAAAILIPKIDKVPLQKDLQGMQLIREYSVHEKPLVLFNPDARQEIEQQLAVPLQIWYLGPGLPGPPPLCALIQPKSMCFSAHINGYHTLAMMDSGASQIFVSTAIAKHMHIPLQQSKIPV